MLQQKIIKTFGIALVLTFSWQFAQSQCSCPGTNGLELGNSTGTTANGQYSLAGGNNSVTNANQSIAFGSNATADATRSFAFGLRTDTDAESSMAFGVEAFTAGGAKSSFALGDTTRVYGPNSFALGSDIEVLADHSYALGEGVQVGSPNTFAVGWNGNQHFRLEMGEALFDANLDIVGDAPAQAGILDVQDNNNNPLLFVRSDGNVGIGTNSPGSKVEIVSNGSSSSTSALDVQDNNNNPLLFVRDDGNIGIGTSSPSEKLVVDGFVIPNSDAVEQLGKSGNRWKELWASNSTIQTSDRRLKSGVDSLKYGLKDLMQLKPISYYNKGQKAEGKHLGLIAQELKKVIKEPVETGSDKRKLKGVRYTSLIPVLINGIQEQQNQIKKQEREIQNLQANLENTQTKNQQLEEKLNELNQKINQLAEQVNGVSESFKKADDESLSQKTAKISNDEDADQAMLLQNRPNPYSNETVIPYYLPENAQNANMLITNSQGQMLKRIPLEATGKGELTLQTTDLNKGQYQYTLIIDGRQIQTRKMIVK